MSVGPIQIDLSELAAEFNLKQTQIEELGTVLVNTITDRLFHNWQQAAMSGLNSTRKAYINSLNIGVISPTKRYIQLTGEWPNMLENGFGAFDMKTGMLSSPKAKMGKNGVKYMSIPFRHGTPGSIGESEVFSGVMPREIYEVVKRLQPSTTTLNRSVQRPKGLRIGQIPPDFRIPKSRAAFSDVKTQTTYPEYVHQGSIYEGMVRKQTTYEGATQGSYMTFRRVSENSDPMAFIHRGVSAKNFAEKSLQKTDVNTITDRTIDTFLQSLGF